MIATLQLINTTPGAGEREVITLQFATFNPEINRDQVEASLRHAAEQLAICLEMKSVARLPIGWQENK